MFGLSAFTGFSRVTSNYHYLSDVMFGATVGLVSGYAYSITHKKYFEETKVLSRSERSQKENLYGARQTQENNSTNYQNSPKTFWSFFAESKNTFGVLLSYSFN
jgi:hypothetical protein